MNGPKDGDGYNRWSMRLSGSKGWRKGDRVLIRDSDSPYFGHSANVLRFQTRHGQMRIVVKIPAGGVSAAGRITEDVEATFLSRDLRWIRRHKKEDDN